MHVVDQTQSHGSDPTWKIITWRQALPGSLCHYCITFGSLCNITIYVYVYYLLWMRIQRVWSLNLKPSGLAGYFFSVDGPGCPFALQGFWLHQLELEIAFVDDSPKLDFCLPQQR